jgi:hypothetical protein
MIYWVTVPERTRICGTAGVAGGFVLIQLLDLLILLPRHLSLLDCNLTVFG